MTFDDLKDLEIDTVLIDSFCKEYLYKGLTKTTRLIAEENNGTGIIQDVPFMVFKNWKIKPSQNTVTLYEYLDCNGCVYFFDKKFKEYNFVNKAIWGKDSEYYQKIPNGRTLKLDLDSWELVDE